MSKLKFGLVGAGGIAQAYAQAFNESKCCELVAVADVRPDAAAALAEIVGGKAYGNYKQFTDLELDAVIVRKVPLTVTLPRLARPSPPLPATLNTTPLPRSLIVML